MAIKFDFSKAYNLNELEKYYGQGEENLEKVLNKNSEGSDFLGWVELPKNYPEEELNKIKKAAEDIRKKANYLVVIGIGGSYLGTKAVENSLKPYFEADDEFKLIYAGHHLSSTYLNELVKFLKDKEYCINVISKSGTTTEPAIAFRILQRELEEKYGEDAKNRIYVTTDREKGALKKLSLQEGYETFVVPDDIGGRFSVISPVGLLPLAAKGVDIDKLLDGFKKGQELFTVVNGKENPAIKYAIIRYLLHSEDNKDIEILVNYEPSLTYISAWWKQLFGESEGKDGKGIFPASVDFTTDLHSMGQLIQEGKRNIFETVIEVENPMEDIEIPFDEQNLDGLNYIAGKTLDYVNKKATEGTRTAHVKGEVPNISIVLDRIDEENLGKLLYFFEISVSISGYLLGVNPFNQPGVEEYKTQMFKLLGKPGFN
ncbi:glucose-6-phosphate isomerase [Mediannikoviicoccus vaginalis]|uniref:glucose-6-phosphate isomerase n=1 Tax=Mediannikoviicoccus vaginalis TaxID=2899727 RepID=UPI002101D88E|nr:glucose-6-phosphate isomerase [Mediannikoviicoccus vaginalis]